MLKLNKCQQKYFSSTQLRLHFLISDFYMRINLIEIYAFFKSIYNIYFTLLDQLEKDMGNHAFKRYYKCPVCERQVWAWAMFEGTPCWNHPGHTISNGALKTIPVVRKIVKAVDGTTGDATTSVYRYEDKMYFTGSQKGSLYVCSRMCRQIGSAIKISGVHHYLLANVKSSDKWVVHERLKDGVESYACKDVNGWQCLYIGQYSLDQIYEAVKSTHVGSYNLSSNNCNHWAERVILKLGKSITVHGNCSCVWGKKAREA